MSSNFPEQGGGQWGQSSEQSWWDTLTGTVTSALDNVAQTVAAGGLRTLFDGGEESSEYNYFENPRERSVAQRNAKDNAIWNSRESLSDALSAASDQPFRVNPPLHHSLRIAGTQNGVTSALPSFDPSNDDASRGTPSDFADAETRLQYTPEIDGTSWRLGSIMNGDTVLASSSGVVPYRHAFRFLYNPTRIDFSAGINTSLPPNDITYGGKVNFYLSDGLGMISFELLLNRIPDVLDEPSFPTSGGLDEATRRILKKQGTILDLEYLMRTINGTHEKFLGYNTLTDTKTATDTEPAQPGLDPDETLEDLIRDQFPGTAKNKKNDDDPYADIGDINFANLTGDLGILMPSPLWLNLGPNMRYWGRVQSLAWSHQMFSINMVPLLTRVQIQFQRNLVLNDSEIPEWEKSTKFYLKSTGDYFDAAIDTGGGTGGDTGGGTGNGYGGYPDPPEQGQEPSRYIWNSLMSAGMTKQAVAGVLGNLEVESGFDPKVNQPDGPGRGIAQWSEGERWDGGASSCVQWCERKGYDPESLQGQVGFLLWEMKGITGFSNWNYNKFIKMNDVAEAAQYFGIGFERFDISNSSMPTRIKNAHKWYREYKDVKPRPTGGGTVSGKIVLPTSAILKEDMASMNFLQQRYNNGGYQHQGEDYSMPSGTPLYAMADGKVSEVAYQAEGAGHYIRINYPIHAGTMQSTYMHLVREPNKSEGDSVTAGERVGTSGNTGRSLGPHLHLEIRINGDLINPNELFRALGWRYPGMNSRSRETPPADFTRERMDNLRFKVFGDNSKKAV